jgi:hypothetical protein
VCVEINGIEPSAPGFSFCEPKEGLSKAFSPIGGMNGDVFNQKALVVNGKDDHPKDRSLAFGDGYSAVCR